MVKKLDGEGKETGEICKVVTCEECKIENCIEC